MYEKTTERSAALDDVIEEYTDSIRAGYSCEIGDASLISEEPIVVVGRIISTATDTGRPTANSLQIEHSRSVAGGKRTRLVFGPNLKVRNGVPGLKGFGLVQGQIMALKGRNGGGGAFVVEEILMPYPSDMPSTDPSDLIRYQASQSNGQPLSVIVAAGPYSLESNLDFEPFHALMDTLSTQRPDALILVSVMQLFYTSSDRAHFAPYIFHQPDGPIYRHVTSVYCIRPSRLDTDRNVLNSLLHSDHTNAGCLPWNTSDSRSQYQRRPESACRIPPSHV